MHQNVTVAEAIVLSCFDLEPPRNRIVFEAGLFPSVRYVQQAWSRFGAEVVVCEDADAVIDAIDERTLLVPVSHVLFKTAEIQPIERIVERAHEAGADVCLDAYQSAGAVPFDVTALGIAFCVGGSVKWLCGGPGAGWLYVRPDVAERLHAGLRRLARSCAAVLVRDRSAARPRRGTLPHGHPRTSPPTTRRAPATAVQDPGDRRRADPRQLDAADGTARRARRRGRVRAHIPRATRRSAAVRSCSASPTSRLCMPSSPPARSSATTGPTRACGSGRTTSRPTTSFVSQSPR